MTTTMNTLKLTIDGMSCGHCLNRVQKALATIPGIQVTSVQIGRATLEYDPATTTPDEIAAVVSATGYRAQVVSS
jgi:copper chaperone CopZ